MLNFANKMKSLLKFQESQASNNSEKIKKKAQPNTQILQKKQNLYTSFFPNALDSNPKRQFDSATTHETLPNNQIEATIIRKSLRDSLTYTQNEWDRNSLDLQLQDYMLNCLETKNQDQYRQSVKQSTELKRKSQNQQPDNDLLKQCFLECEQIQVPKNVLVTQVGNSPIIQSNMNQINQQNAFKKGNLKENGSKLKKNRFQKCLNLQHEGYKIKSINEIADEIFNPNKKKQQQTSQIKVPQMLSDRKISCQSEQSQANSLIITQQIQIKQNNNINQKIMQNLYINIIKDQLNQKLQSSNSKDRQKIHLPIDCFANQKFVQKQQLSGKDISKQYKKKQQLSFHLLTPSRSKNSRQKALQQLIESKQIVLQKQIQIQNKITTLPYNGNSPYSRIQSQNSISPQKSHKKIPKPKLNPTNDKTKLSGVVIFSHQQSLNHKNHNIINLESFNSDNLLASPNNARSISTITSTNNLGQTNKIKSANNLNLGQADKIKSANNLGSTHNLKSTKNQASTTSTNLEPNNKLASTNNLGSTGHLKFANSLEYESQQKSTNNISTRPTLISLQLADKSNNEKKSSISKQVQRPRSRSPRPNVNFHYRTENSEQKPKISNSSSLQKSKKQLNNKVIHLAPIQAKPLNFGQVITLSPRQANPNKQNFERGRLVSRQQNGNSTYFPKQYSTYSSNQWLQPESQRRMPIFLQKLRRINSFYPNFNHPLSLLNETKIKNQLKTILNTIKSTVSVIQLLYKKLNVKRNQIQYFYYLLHESIKAKKYSQSQGKKQSQSQGKKLQQEIREMIMVSLFQDQKIQQIELLKPKQRFLPRPLNEQKLLTSILSFKQFVNYYLQKFEMDLKTQNGRQRYLKIRKQLFKIQKYIRSISQDLYVFWLGQCNLPLTYEPLCNFFKGIRLNHVPNNFNNLEILNIVFEGRSGNQLLSCSVIGDRIIQYLLPDQ